MMIDGKTVLVTGASRGIGQALVEEALRRGAGRVYAAARHPVADPDERVRPLSVDVTSAVQIQEAAGRVESLDVLINNAGVQPLDDLSDPAALEQALAVNLLGPYRVSQAFLPALTRSRGTIVNNVSLAALAPVPFAPAYSISKAAALSLTQSLRMLLARHGVSVRSVLTGPVDTEMTRGLEIPKASPNPWRERSSTASRTETRTSSPTCCPRPWPRAGAPAWPSSSSARTQHCCPPPNPSRADTRSDTVRCWAGRTRRGRSRATDVHLTGGATGIRRRHDLLTDPPERLILREARKVDTTMKTPPIVTAQEWEAARQQLLVKEKELTRARQAQPMTTFL